jgi:hypothetical protein
MILANSITSSNSEATVNFGKCVNQMSKLAVEDAVQTAYNKQAIAMTKVAGLGSMISATGNDIKQKSDNIQASYNQLTNKVNDVKNAQLSSTVVNQTVASNLSTFTTTVNNLFQNIGTFLPKLT